ncbi:hypothetical protein Ahy_A04g017974 [Arachis hypogaea]|uniref:Uncharacterized protein n=1 Tax=Arachis hypogaea TaxID=3818 RepID=A0A445DCH9_ARAHY|nr:hypothetical protein Ahy_A04g017974 [Arachis hypogaea]
MIDVRCRDFLDDLASRDQPKIRLAYQFFSFFMTVRNELGYLATLFSRFDVMLTFTMTKACDKFCTNITLSIPSALASIYSNESGARKDMTFTLNYTLQIILY